VGSAGNLNQTSEEECLFFAEELGLWAIEYIRSHRPSEVTTKSGPADLVTETDRAVEQHVRTEIAGRFPAHRVVGEEFGADAGEPTEGPTWFVDRGAGTTDYVSGVPFASFSLALADADGAVVGVVADPYRAEVFSAARGRGAQCNGVAVRCSAATALAGGIVLTEWSGSRPWDGMLEMLGALADQACTTRIMGSSALSLATAAAGRGLGVVLGGYNTWDVLAGVIIAKEAGARVIGRDGNDAPPLPSVADGGLLAAGPGVIDVIWQAWQKGSSTGEG